MNFTSQQSARERFDQAWFSLLGSEPFYAAQMFSLEIIETALVPTFETDGKCLTYNPEFLQECTLEEIETIDLHEILHIVLLHHVIMAEMAIELGPRFDHMTFNKAADEEVNWILKRMGRTLKDGAWIHEEYDGWLVRDIYFDIERKEQEEQQQQQQQNQNDQSNENSDDSSNDSGSNTESDSNDGTEENGDDKGSDNNDGDSDDSDGDSSDQNDPETSGNSSNDDDDNSTGNGANDSGDDGDKDTQSSVNGSSGSGESFDGDMGQIRMPVNDDGSALNSEQVEALRRDAENEIISAWKFSESQGKGNPIIDKIIESMLSKPVPWYEIVRELLTNIENGNTDWNRLDKRHLTRGMYIPSVERIVEGKICFMVDVSGSVSDELVREWEEKINEILAELPFCEILVIFFHHDAYRYEEYTSDDLPIKLHERESGGTRYTPPFLLMNDLGFDPDCVMVLTDLLCSDFPDTPDFPVLWCYANSYSGYSDYGREVPFGDVIELKE